MIRARRHRDQPAARPNRDSRVASANYVRRCIDRDNGPFMYLHRALRDPSPEERRKSTAWIRALHRRRDLEVGQDLCFALRDMEDWPAIPRDTPAACYVDAVHEAHGYRLNLMGVAVLLDDIKRWWMSLRLYVDGVLTAVLRRFGRHAETEQENLVPRAREVEWRRACSIWPGVVRERRRLASEWIALNGNTAPLLDIDPRLAYPRLDRRGREIPTPIYIPQGGSVDGVLDELAASPWAGWAPAQAVAAYQLGLTRWGYGVWF